MLKRTKISAAAMLVVGGAFGVAAMAQDATQRVEITGSSIKRVDSEAALPVTVITQQDIARSGAVDVTDLIQKLPAMQGFLTASTSVNGGGGGNSNASLHAIGAQYTLVLLNGRRLAPYNTGTTVNLQSIPIAAIERVEVLTDGASAIYGADAIAGVVNFILKKDSTEGVVSLTGSSPQHPGGGSYSFSATKGFGNIDTDRFNVLVSAAYDKQNELYAPQRSFSNSGFRPFTYNGQNVTEFQGSSNSVPANVGLLTDSSGQGAPGSNPNNIDGSAFFNPYQTSTGTCAPNSVLRGGYCNYDYSRLVDLVPESERTSVFGSARFKVNESISLFSELALSRFDTTPKYAPPAQPGIFLTQALYNKDIVPLLPKLGINPAQVVQPGDPNFNGPYMNLRLYDAGNRQDKYRTDTTHFVFGAEGQVGNWDASAYYTHSQNKSTDFAMSGYASANTFNSLIASGAFDPITSLVGTAVSALAPAVLHQILDQSTSSIDVLSAKASGALTRLPGGDLSLGVGAEYIKQEYKDDPSAILQGANALQPNFTDTIIGGGGGALPFDSKRNSFGLFGELVAPVTKQFEVSGAVRYDNYGAVKNSENFDASGNPAPAATQGTTASSTTYKLSLRFQPVKELLLRGSYGTGFKAPALSSITQPLQAFGNTSGSYSCPYGPNLNPSQAYLCPANPSAQYNELSGGNPSTGAGALKPEKSDQWTMGFRVEPSEVISFGADLWDVRLKDRIDTIPEAVAFGNPTTYASLFSVVPDPITGKPSITFLSVPSNQGKAHYEGIDLDVISKVKLPIGGLTSRLAATYMMKADYEVPGLPGYQTSLGQYGTDNSVVFRYLINGSATLETGSFANTLSVAYKPAYRDAHYNDTSTANIVRIVNADGTIGARTPVARDVSSYTIVNWQTKYDLDKSLSITGGIKNLFDTNPPFSLQSAGGGNQVGYDGRYADPLGRTFYLTGNYKF